MPSTAVLPIAARQGTIPTGNMPLPVGIMRLLVQLNINTADKTNPALTINLLAFVSMDGGTVWFDIGGLAWRGNPSGRDPELGLYGLDRYPGGLIQAEVVIPLSTRVGATVIWT